MGMVVGWFGGCCGMLWFGIGAGLGDWVSGWFVVTCISATDPGGISCPIGTLHLLPAGALVIVHVLWCTVVPAAGLLVLVSDLFRLGYDNWAMPKPMCDVIFRLPTELAEA